MNVISSTYQLTEDVTVTITMRSTRVLTAREVRAFGILAEAAEKVGAEQEAAKADEL